MTRGQLRGSFAWGCVCAASVACACAGKSASPSQADAGNQGGSAGTAVSSAGTAQTGGGGVGPASACEGATPPAVTSSGRIDIPVQVIVGGTPLTLGVPGVGANGREFNVSLLLFFLTEPAFVDLNGHESKAQIIEPTGQPSAYGLQLVNADEPATQLLRLTAPAGNYAALHLGVGVPAACNAISATNQVYPLNPDSEMIWTWGSQYMFVRVEGFSRPDATAEWSPFAYHVGFDAAFASITVPGDLIVPAAGAAGGASAAPPTLTLDLERMLATEAQMLPSTKHSVPDGWVVDNLESNQAFGFR